MIADRGPGTMPIGIRSRDPREIAPVGSYFRASDKSRMVEIIEVDWSGALGEDLVTGTLVEIDRAELLQKWIRVRARRTEAVEAGRGTE